LPAPSFGVGLRLALHGFMRPLILILSVLCSTAFAASPCDYNFLEKSMRFPTVDWRPLSDKQRLGILVSQITSVFMIGVIPTQSNLNRLTEEQAAAAGWSSKDLRLIPQRAENLLGEINSSGLNKLAELAAIRLKPLPREETVAAQEPAAAVEPAPPPAVSIEPEQADHMTNAEVQVLLRNQVHALVTAGLLNSIMDLRFITQEDLDEHALEITTEDLRRLNVRAATAFPEQIIQNRHVNGLVQLMLECGLPLEKILDYRTDPPKPTVPRAWRPPKERGLPKEMQPLRTVVEFLLLPWHQRKELGLVYRTEARAILERILRIDAKAPMAAADLKLWAEGADLSGTDLTVALIESLPQRAEVGFVHMNGYRGLLEEFGLSLGLEETMQMTGTRRIAPEDYIPPTFRQAEHEPIMPLASGPVREATPGQTELLALYHQLEAKGYDLDILSLRTLTRDQMLQFGWRLTGADLEQYIREQFKGGWRDWVTEAGGDPDQIVLLARGRGPTSH